MASSKLCNPCRAQNRIVNGTTWCPDCEEYLCSKCTAYHKSLGITRTHNLIEVKGLKQIPPEITKLQCCPRHSSLRFEYFCSSHDSICCRTCLTEDHKSCEYIQALELVCSDSNTSTLSESEEKLKHISTTLDDVNAKVETHNENFKNQYTKVKDNIATEKARAIEKLEKQEEDLLKELEDEKKKVDTDREKTRQCMKDLGLTISERLQQIQFVQEHGTCKQAFLLSHFLRKFIQNSEQSMSEILKNYKHSKLTFEENKDILKTDTSIGSSIVSPKSNSVQHTPLTEKHAQSPSQLPLSSFKVTSSFKTNDQSNVLGMICTDDNRLLLCNFTPDNAILVYSGDGRQIQTITMEHKAHDIAEIPEGGQYVVTLPYLRSIQFIEKNNLEAGKSVKVDTDNNVNGIAASEQFIYVGGYKTIFKLNIEGSILKRIPTPGWSSTYYLSLQNKTLFAANMGCEMMTIDTESDSIQQRCNKNVTDEPKLLRKIIADRHRYVYVGGQDSGKIYRMTKDLERDIVITDNTFRDIGAICFNKDCSKIFVSNDRGKSIIILDCS